MGDIILRKDNTSISCPRSSLYVSERKTRFIEVAIAVIFIVAGASIMIIIQ